jgi:RNA polymerase subunit RPABC4/transcription elongation factor Spt4
MEFFFLRSLGLIVAVVIKPDAKALAEKGVRVCGTCRRLLDEAALQCPNCERPLLGDPFSQTLIRVFKKESDANVGD